eukprot:m.347334 g.347334  ORF g.347334 m.347334 type:complete len:53 (+) comp27921_c0_seq1:4197-4355(+)
MTHTLIWALHDFDFELAQLQLDSVLKQQQQTCRSRLSARHFSLVSTRAMATR